MAPGNNHVTAISSEIFKYVRIQPNFASWPVLCEKMVLYFFPKSMEKRLDEQAQKSSPTLPLPPPPPPPPPSVPPNDVKRILAVFLPCSTECPLCDCCPEPFNCCHLGWETHLQNFSYKDLIEQITVSWCLSQFRKLHKRQWLLQWTTTLIVCKCQPEWMKQPLLLGLT